MDTAQGKLAFQVQFWGLIGPLIALITSFVILIKSPPEAIYLSIATIIGLIASWKWKAKGVLFSFGLMLLLYLYHFSGIEPDEHLWHIGMNISIVLGCAITALSWQEVEALLETPEKSLALEEVEEVKSEDSVSDYTTLVETMRQEALQISKQHEKLVQELMTKTSALSLAEERLHALSQKIEEHSETLKIKEKEGEELKKEVESLKIQKREPAVVVDQTALSELKNSNELLSRERGRLESLLFRTQIELHQKTQDLANLPLFEMEKEQLKAELESLNNQLKEATLAKEDFKQKVETSWQLLEAEMEAKQAIAAINQSLKEQLETRPLHEKEEELPVSLLSKEKLPFELKKIEGRYRQLREQFQLKSELLDETRKELFQKEEAYLQAKLQLKELQEYHFSDSDAYFLTVIEKSNQKISSLEQEIQDLQSIIHSLIN